MTERALFRVVAMLSVDAGRLVRTESFTPRQYLGDPSIAARILSDFECDELILSDISASRLGTTRSFDQRCLAEATRCPLTVCGAVSTLHDVESLVDGGAERVGVNSLLADDQGLERFGEMVREFGQSTMVASIDVRWRNGSVVAFTHGATRQHQRPLAELLGRVSDLGAGEVLIHDAQRNGSRQGFDTALLEALTTMASAPKIFCGGAQSVDDLLAVASRSGFSAAGAGSIFSVIGPHDAPLIRYASTPTRRQRNEPHAHSL
jgi:imidazole glycerol-phosphate synthase subunit HisF